ncbi:MAG: hypothetical protein ACFN0Y_04465 [Lactobacillus sp.]
MDHNSDYQQAQALGYQTPAEVWAFFQEMGLDYNSLFQMTYGISFDDFVSRINRKQKEEAYAKQRSKEFGEAPGRSLLQKILLSCENPSAIKAFVDQPGASNVFEMTNGLVNVRQTKENLAALAESPDVLTAKNEGYLSDEDLWRDFLVYRIDYNSNFQRRYGVSLDNYVSRGH